LTRSRSVLVVALLAAFPVLAQEAKAPAPAPAPAAKSAPAAKPAPAPAAKPAPAKPAATELARLLMPKKTWAEGIDRLGDMVQSRMSMRPGQQVEFPKDFKSKAKAELEAVLSYDELIGLHAKELGAAFTDGELADLTAFYQSPTGQKALVKMGDVQNTVGLETQKRIEGAMPGITKKLSALVKVSPAKEGKSMGGATGAKPPGHP
jgi:hypothetical protein